MGNFVSNENDENDFNYYDCYEASTEEEPEPFELSSLPQNLFNAIMDKLDYNNYVKIEEVSKFTAVACNRAKFSLEKFAPYIYVNKRTVTLIPDRFDDSIISDLRMSFYTAAATAARINCHSCSIDCRASSGRIQAVAKIFEKNKTTATSIELTQHILFNAKDLLRIVKALKVQDIYCYQFMSKELFLPETFNNLSSLHINSCGFTDDEFLKLKVRDLFMTNDYVTARGYNHFLKQWKRREREITQINIQFGSSFNTRNFDVILEGLDASLLWSPDSHRHSLVGGIRLEEYYLMENGDPPHVYSIWRPDEPTANIIILLRMGNFDIRTDREEAEFVLRYLNEDQYYKIVNECKWCMEQFCYHRRRYSTQRFKAFFPWTYKAIITSIKVARMILSVAQHFRIILEASRPVQSFTNENLNRVLFEEDAQTVLHNRWLQLRAFLFND